MLVRPVAEQGQAGVVGQGVRQVFAMDPRGVREQGDEIARAGDRTRVVADSLRGLSLAPTGDGWGLGADLAEALAVWADGARALGSELEVLAERCAVSARGVETEDESARSLFARRASARPLSGAG